MRNDTFFARRHDKLFKTKDFSFDLNVGNVAGQFVDTIYFAAVDILVGIIFKQVAPGFYIELLVQYVLSSGTYPRKIHDVLR